MPDHPSWPAELVEKAADVIMEFVELRYDETVDCTVVARTLASALSGDLVPREVHDNTMSWIAPLRDRAAQADALAEALEATWMAGSWELADAPCDQEDPCVPDDPDCEPCEQRAALKKMDAALASYRSKPAPGETK